MIKTLKMFRTHLILYYLICGSFWSLWLPSPLSPFLSHVYFLGLGWKKLYLVIILVDLDHFRPEDTPLSLCPLGAFEILNVRSKFEGNRIYSSWVRSIFFIKEYSKTMVWNESEARKQKNRFFNVSVIKY